MIRSPYSQQLIESGGRRRVKVIAPFELEQEDFYFTDNGFPFPP